MRVRSRESHDDPHVRMDPVPSPSSWVALPSVHMHPVTNQIRTTRNHVVDDEKCAGRLVVDGPTKHMQIFLRRRGFLSPQHPRIGGQGIKVDRGLSLVSSL